MKKLLLFLTVLLLPLSCTQVAEVDWAAVPGSSNYVLDYHAGGIPRQKKVALREAELLQLRDYLQAFVQEGKSTLVTYAPGLVLSGEYYALNFLHNGELVVLNIRQQGEAVSRQFVRKRSAVDDALLELLHRRSQTRSLRR